LSGTTWILYPNFPIQFSNSQTLTVIASEAKQSTFAETKQKLDCFFAELVIGRAFARPVGSSQ